jgi:thiol-disulfide isomerase/thioredoxin
MSTPTARRGPTRRTRAALLRRGTVIAGVAAVVAAAVGLAVAVTGPQQSAGSDAAEQASTPASEGEALPDLAFATLGGEQTSLGTVADDQGLVINFFVSWCAPCLEELPAFQAAYQDHGDEVGVFGLNLQDDPNAARGLVDRFGLAYPIGVDPQGELFKALGGHAMPTTIFVRPDGTIAEIHGGELTAEQLRERLRTHELIS